MSSDEDGEEPTHYHFRISLRFRHPSVDPEKITEALGIEPDRCWKAGEPRRTPTGTPLDGTYPDSYWVVDIAAGRWPVEVNDAIHESLRRLARHRSFLHKIRAEGGTVEFFVGWFFENQSGDTLTHQCLALAGDLWVDLTFDVYPPSQPQKEYEVEEDILPP